MKVSELIELLKDQDPDQEVHFAYPYGDYTRNTVATRVKDVQEALVTFSDYHRDFTVDKDDAYEEDEETGEAIPNEKEAVLLLVG